jgi:hypothetical protein
MASALLWITATTQGAAVILLPLEGTGLYTSPSPCGEEQFTMPLLAKGQANAKAQRRKGTQRNPSKKISVVWNG